jgi:putative ABC transport system permease protein
MTLGKQFASLLRMNLASIPVRPGLVLTILIGVATAVGVLIAMLAMGAGAQREARGNTRPDRVILRSLGAQGALASSISRDTAVLLRELPGIKRNAQGEPIALGAVLVIIQARNKADNSPISFPLVGLTPGLTDYQPELHMTAGRMFRPGLHELIASNKCAKQLASFAVGDTRTLRGGGWPVVGNFDLGSISGQCVVLADADTVLSAYSRDAYNQYQVMLQSPATLAVLQKAIKANPQLRIQTQLEEESVKQDMSQVNNILNFVSIFVGGIMAIAASIGAANSLYAIIDGRRREIATLRAIGFSALPVMASVLSESVLLALPGALLGALVAWLSVNGLAASPFGMSFHLAVTPFLVLVGLAWAFVMGALAGLLPAVRAARVPVTVALRAT